MVVGGLPATVILEYESPTIPFSGGSGSSTPTGAFSAPLASTAGACVDRPRDRRGYLGVAVLVRGDRWRRGPLTTSA